MKKTIQFVKDCLNLPYIAKVQKAVIPFLIKKRDIVVNAVTGSGKTLAYLLPIFSYLTSSENISLSSSTRILIILPSRELSMQVYSIVSQFCKQFNHTSSLIISGITFETTKNEVMKSPEIIIATLGRLYNLRNFIKFNNIKFLILDEADKMIESNHLSQLNEILLLLPKEKTVGLFSATMTSALEEIIKIGLNSPYLIQIEQESKTKNQNTILSCDNDSHLYNIKELSKNNQIFSKQYNDSKIVSRGKAKEKSNIPYQLINSYIILEKYEEKLDILCQASKEFQKIIVFVATCSMSEFIGSILKVIPSFSNFKIFKTHGNANPKQRIKVFNNFKNISKGILISTDLLSRGIDFEDIDLVVQFDPPQHSDTFVHRVGRTGRAGRSGNTLIVLMKSETSYLEYLRLKKIDLKEYQKSINIQTINEIENAIFEDKNLLDKAEKAFLSYLRYYKEHELKYLFVLKEIDAGSLAHSLGLIRIPKLKEFKNMNLSNFQPKNFEISQIEYKDQNVKKQKEESKEKRALNKLKNKIPIKKVIKKDKPKKTRAIREKKKKEDFMQEWEDLSMEENLYKKLKRGKITEEEYNKKLGNNFKF